MRGTILDFLKLANEKPELAKELVELATKYDFEFSDEVSDEDLEAVSGGGGEIDESQYDAALDAAKESKTASHDLMRSLLLKMTAVVDDTSTSPIRSIVNRL